MKVNINELIDEIGQIVNSTDDLNFVAIRNSDEVIEKNFEKFQSSMSKSKFYVPSDNAIKFSVVELKKYINKLNSDKNFPYNKWRLPTIEELKIIDFNHSRIFEEEYERKYIYNHSLFWGIDSTIPKNKNNFAGYNFYSGHYYLDSYGSNRLLLICDKC